MGLDAGTPPGLRETVQRIAEEAVAKFARSGFLRNASISDGGLSVKGGFFRMLSRSTGGVTMFYLGPGGPALPDGTAQQIWFVNRFDGTRVLDMFDADVADGQVRQALGWRDRTGNVVFADDTDSGQGIGRPYLPIIFYRSFFNGTDSTTNDTFTTIWGGSTYKQHPKMVVAAAVAVDAGTTGELRVLVNGTQLGATQAVTASQAFLFGPAAASGAHMAMQTVEIQIRRTAGAGNVSVVPNYGFGVQS